VIVPQSEASKSRLRFLDDISTSSQLSNVFIRTGLQTHILKDSHLSRRSSALFRTDFSVGGRGPNDHSKEAEEKRWISQRASLSLLETIYAGISVKLKRPSTRISSQVPAKSLVPPSNCSCGDLIRSCLSISGSRAGQTRC
jgi:hypothetical protein